MNKQQYEKWLKKKGLSRDQVITKKRALGPVNSIPDYKTASPYKLSNAIPANGTKSTDTMKADFANANYCTAPAYNKGPIMLVTKDDLRNGAGRKV